MTFLVKNNNILPIILFCIVLFLFITIFIFESAALERVILPFLISFLVYGIVFISLNKIFNDKFISKIYLISALLHLIFILFWNIFKYHLLGYALPSPNIFVPYTIDNDGALYHSYGVAISQNFTFDNLSEKLAGGWYPKIVGIIYHYFGINPTVVCLVNSFFSTLVAPILYLIGKYTFNNIQISRIYSLISILTFSHIMNTSSMIRDGYITLFMYLSIFLSFMFYKRKNLSYFFLTCLSLFCLYSFRPYACYVIFFAMIISYGITKIHLKITKQNIKTNRFSLTLVILSPALVIGLLFLLNYVFSSMNILSVNDLIEVREVAYQYADAAIAFDFASLYSKFFLLPFIIGYIYIFMAPFPWEWIKPSRIVYIPDMLILYCFLPAFFKNIKKVFTDKNYLLVICFFSIFFMFSIYCITLGNTGAIHRLRGPFIPMIYLIAMYRPNKFLSRIINKIQKWRIV